MISQTGPAEGTRVSRETPRWQEEVAEGGTLMELNEKYQKFDAANYLKNLDDVAALLEGALEDSAEDLLQSPTPSGSSRARKT